MIAEYGTIGMAVQTPQVFQAQSIQGTVSQTNYTKDGNVLDNSLQSQGQGQTQPYEQ